MSTPFLYPNVSSVPVRNAEVQSQRPARGGGPSESGPDFQDVLDQIRAPLKFSAHATQRLKDRKIALDPSTLSKVNDALDRAEAKGIEDTLVITSDAALIVNVKNRTVITAMDRGSMSGNVFTNIDGAVVV